MFSGKFYNYDSYCSMYEDVFEWILEAFDDLNSMEDLADDLESIKCQVPALKFNFKGSSSTVWTKPVVLAKNMKLTTFMS